VRNLIFHTPCNASYSYPGHILEEFLVVFPQILKFRNWYKHIPAMIANLVFYRTLLPFRLCFGRIIRLKSSFSTYFLTVSKSCPVILDIFLKLLPSNFFMFLILYTCSIVSILSITPFKCGQLKGYYFLGVLAMEFPFYAGIFKFRSARFLLYRKQYIIKQNKPAILLRIE